MNIFKLDDTDFGIGELICKIENGTIEDLTIIADKKTTALVTADENGKWGYLITPPKVFFWKVPFEQVNNEIEINDDLLDEYDISFYLEEHHDIYGKLTINDNNIMISGEVRYHMDDEKLYSIEIVAER